MLNISNNNNNNNNNDNDDDNDNDNDNDNDLDYTQISLKRFAFSMATRAFVRATITLIAITMESYHNLNCWLLYFAVVSKPEFIVHPASRVVALGTNVTLSCVAIGFPEPVIGWLKNNESLENATTVKNQSQSFLVLHSFKPEKSNATYSCVARNSLGETYSNEATIQVSRYKASKF